MISMARMFGRCTGTGPTPVVVISGFLSNDSRLALTEAGIQYMLEKPFKKAALIELMHRAIGA